MCVLAFEGSSRGLHDLLRPSKIDTVDERDADYRWALTSPRWLLRSHARSFLANWRCVLIMEWIIQSNPKTSRSVSILLVFRLIPVPPESEQREWMELAGEKSKEEKCLFFICIFETWNDARTHESVEVCLTSVLIFSRLSRALN